MAAGRASRSAATESDARGRQGGERRAPHTHTSAGHSAENRDGAVEKIRFGIPPQRLLPDCNFLIRCMALHIISDLLCGGFSVVFCVADGAWAKALGIEKPPTRRRQGSCCKCGGVARPAEPGSPRTALQAPCGASGAGIGIPEGSRALLQPTGWLEGLRWTIRLRGAWPLPARERPPASGQRQSSRDSSHGLTTCAGGAASATGISGLGAAGAAGFAFRGLAGWYGSGRQKSG